MIKTVTISKLCVNKGCKRVGTRATRLSDFWVVWCDHCYDKQVTLDMKKIPPENTRKRRAAAGGVY